MKVKELERTVNVAWSPPSQHPVLLAAGTAAQQLDASFSTNAALELYSLNLSDPGLDMELKTSVPSPNRFHKLAWGGASPGVIVGGCDSGRIQMYSVPKLLSGEDPLLTAKDRHTGSVRALDFNPFQTNLLSSGASESEIYIWDLNNTSTPMTPGAKPQPFEDVIWLSWNKQVQHILASTFATRCIIWDLRKNEPIIKLSDSTSRVRWKVLAWHPDVATQLCLASEEDSNPVVQLWDLRFATSPLKTLQGHTRGVLSLSWCSQDPDLLISSAKDNRILCWNPNTNDAGSEIVCEIPNTQQWIFEVSWCPRNPSLIASCSCDGHASIYSLTGSHNQVQTSNKIADSFPGMEAYNQPEPSQHTSDTVDLRKAPKWLRRPVGASFGFGGKLVSFNQEGILMCQVKTEEKLLERARDLQQNLDEGRFREVCQGKSDELWRYLEASFSDDPRSSIRTLLGYAPLPQKKKVNIGVDKVTDQFAALSQEDNSFENSLGSVGSFPQNGSTCFDEFAQTVPEKRPATQFQIQADNGLDGRICQALLVGGVEEAVEICLNETRYADALILSMAAGQDLLTKTQRRYFDEENTALGYLMEAVVTGDWHYVVETADVNSWKEVLVAILTYCKDEELPTLCEVLGGRLEKSGGAENLASAEVCYIASGNMAPLIHKRTSTATLTTDSVQELVELVLVGLCAMTQRGQPIPVAGELATLIAFYAELIASQGDLETALRFLNDIQEESIEELKDRLYCALGLKTQFDSSTVQQHSQPSQFRKHSASMQAPIQSSHMPMLSQQSSMYKPQIPMAPPQVPLTTSMVGSKQVYQGSMYQGGRTTPQPGPPPSTNAPLPSASLRSTPSPLQSQSGLASKKYVVDPSVQRSTSSHMGYPQVAPQPPLYPQTPPNPALTPTPTNFPSKPPGPPAQGVFTPQAQSGVFTPQVTPNNYRGSTNLPHPPSAQTNNPSAPGWNDPPPFTSPPRSQPKMDVSQQPPITHPLFGSAPTHGQPQFSTQHQGIPSPSSQQQFGGGPPPSSQQQFGGVPPPTSQQQFGGAPPPSSQQQFGPPPHPQSSQIGAPPPSFGGAPQTQFPTTHQGNFHSIPQSGGPPPTSQGSFPTPSLGIHMQGNFQPPQGTVVPPQQSSSSNGPPYEAQKVREPPKQKPPLPDQYQHFQVVLENLRGKFNPSTSNAQLKRKMDDVGRKLETLYDAIRESRLSPGSLAGLERIVSHVESGDYASALQQHTAMVSGPDFSQIASFMPGLKTLIQTAFQYGIYLQ